ncbi:hypothetical protein J2X31_002167 [Flavobacterium arsenatis]|uniref:Knr4/Smi1-like domain-containing protein n=1 Tax=Flavobacterium arsenatis TaxID=1484332 RepID=A0ABU1TR86_9FLAO|nr:SMI1/KNR4 family protein [Flavobacterium arsenatis]MDR6968152.1 hypothetical protein [Flavobacterium arsenatis]
MENKDFWDLTKPATFKSLTEELIYKAENELKIQLPKRLIELLKIKNGGRINKIKLHSQDNTIWTDGFYQIDELFGINDENSKKLGILSTSYLTAEWELPEKQVIITGGGHWWITLDYRNNSQEPTVNWIEPEARRDIIIAKNFTEFINNFSINQKQKTLDVETNGMITIWEDFLNEDELKELSITDLNLVNERRKEKGLSEIKKNRS